MVLRSLYAAASVVLSLPRTIEFQFIVLKDIALAAVLFEVRKGLRRHALVA